ncbi:unnamed protein product [Absidia cylindrospora]
MASPILGLNYRPSLSNTSSAAEAAALSPSIRQKIPLPQLPSYDIQVVLSHHSFTLPQATHIPIRWLMTETSTHNLKMKSSTTPPTLLLQAKLQRSIKVTHTTIYQEDYTTISRAERSWQPRRSQGGQQQQPVVVDMGLPLVFAGEDFGDSSSSTTTRRPPTKTLHPTMEYSKKFRIQYRVILSVKMRQGSKLSGTANKKKKQTVILPIHIATLCQGTKPPAALVPFTHQEVLDDDTMHTKPKFLPPPPSQLNDLPPYDPKDNPPAYLLA